MTGAAPWRSNNASGNKVGKPIIGRVKRRELGDRPTPVCDDHFFTSLHATDVLAETILEIANPDL